VLGAAALGAAIGSWQSSAGSSDAASRLVLQGLDAARAAGSFHYVSTSVASSMTQVTVGDAGATEGRQDITIGPSSFIVLVVGQTAYLRGDASALEHNLLVPSSVASAHVQQWISLVQSDYPWASVYAAVKTSDALKDNLTFTPRSVLAPETLAGQQVVGIQGPVSGSEAQGVQGTATLYLQAGGRHLPVRFVERGTVTGTGNSGSGNSGTGNTGAGNSGRGNTGGGSTTTSVRFRIDFSAWGEPVHVAVPSSAVSFASLGVPGAGPPRSTPSTVLT